MIVYKINVLQELEEAGYSPGRIAKEKLISQAALQDFRRGKMVGMKTLNKLCKLLEMQPGHILKYIPDNTED